MYVHIASYRYVATKDDIKFVANISIQRCVGTVEPRFLLHHSNTDSEDVYVSFGVFPFTHALMFN